MIDTYNLIGLIISGLAFLLSVISISLSLNKFRKEQPNITLQIENVRLNTSNRLFMKLIISNKSLKNITLKQIYLVADKIKYNAGFANAKDRFIFIEKIRDVEVEYYGSVSIDSYFINFQNTNLKKLIIYVDTPVKCFKFNITEEFYKIAKLPVK